jgi:hypothetical protein
MRIQFEMHAQWNCNVGRVLLSLDYPPSPERLEGRILGVGNVEGIGGQGVDAVVVKGLAGAGLFVMIGERRQKTIGGRGGTTGGHRNHLLLLLLLFLFLFLFLCRKRDGKSRSTKPITSPTH